MIALNVTLVVIIATVFISLMALNDRDLKYKLTFSPYAVKHHGKWWQVFSHGFVHADFMHLALNMYVLHSFGEYVEYAFKEHFGSVNGTIYYIGLYVGGLLFATLPALRKNADNPGYLAVGASGAVSAVVFVSIILQPLGGIGLVFIPNFTLPSFVFGAIYIIAEHYMNQKGTGRIAHDAHIAGAIFGIVYLVFIDYYFFVEFFNDINAWFGNKFS